VERRRITLEGGIREKILFWKRDRPVRGQRFGKVERLGVLGIKKKDSTRSLPSEKEKHHQQGEDQSFPFREASHGTRIGIPVTGKGYFELYQGKFDD